MRPDVLAALRRLALAVSLLHDVDLACRDDGVHLAGVPAPVPWPSLLAAALPAGSDRLLDAEALEPAVLRPRLARQLRAVQAGAALRAQGPDRLAAALVPLGLPADAVDHPGPGWASLRVPGGALDLGPALDVSDPARAEAAPPLPLTPWALRTLDATADPVLLRVRLEAAGRTAAGRLSRGDGVLRPLGALDVVTLLGARSLRAALVAGDPVGMVAVAVPARRRGWTGLRHVDPAFAVAAAAATAAPERGFRGPVLVTADEVALARTSERLAAAALRSAPPLSPGAT
ncbi:hypothetical protein [Vallicoccus soli]|uniref:Uncharacterized protein n=1 Tax=Vallicoccus soli TaxID=2339232 RepID=A0A3A3YQD6_9ACTN|nr:hypothetical protein [Vallicoccus soli]RJK92915.1 hypothetical protein D5H78_17470 [Vallicoccus soli]